MTCFTFLFLCRTHFGANENVLMFAFFCCFIAAIMRSLKVKRDATAKNAHRREMHNAFYLLRTCAYAGAMSHRASNAIFSLRFTLRPLACAIQMVFAECAKQNSRQVLQHSPNFVWPESHSLCVTRSEWRQMAQRESEENRNNFGPMQD